MAIFVWTMNNAYQKQYMLACAFAALRNTKML